MRCSEPSRGTGRRGDWSDPGGTSLHGLRQTALGARRIANRSRNLAQSASDHGSRRAFSAVEPIIAASNFFSCDPASDRSDCQASR
jgi:hypothetical protein